MLTATRFSADFRPGPALINRDEFLSGRLRIWFQMRRPDMPRKRYQAEDIIPKLREAEVLLFQHDERVVSGAVTIVAAS